MSWMGSRKVVSEYMLVMPVVHESTIRKGLSQAVEKTEAETADKNLNFDAEISETAVKASLGFPILQVQKSVKHIMRHIAPFEAGARSAWQEKRLILSTWH